MKKLITPNTTLMMVCILLLAGLGLIMVYSASYIVAEQRFGDAYYFLKRQAMFAVVGVGVLLVMVRIPLSLWRSTSMLGFLVALFALMAVLWSPLGVQVGGAQRWLRLGAFRLQPSELLKPMLVLMLAQHFAKRVLQRNWHGPESKDLMWPLCAVGLGIGLLMLQPDFGTSVTLFMLGLLMLFIVGLKLRYIVFSGLAAMPFIYAFILNVDYRRRRLLAFLDPWADAHDSGFQIIQSYVGFQRGGLMGTGLGAGQQKLFYLPEAHTDFVFTIIGEELGLLGVLLVLCLFFLLFWEGLRIARTTNDPFIQYLSIGLTGLLCFQALTNIAVVMGLMPTKGLPLPFISYGGSALLSSFWIGGLLIRCGREAAP